MSNVAEFSRLKIGESARCELELTEELIARFAELSQDDNPLHMDQAFARASGFERRVAHGMLALGMISRLIGTQLPGPGSLWVSQDVQFAAPACAGDVLAARVTVQKLSRAAQIVELATEVTRVESEQGGEPGEGGTVVLRGTARVRIPTG